MKDGLAGHRYKLVVSVGPNPTHSKEALYVPVFRVAITRYLCLKQQKFAFSQNCEIPVSADWALLNLSPRLAGDRLLAASSLISTVHTHISVPTCSS